MSEWRENHNSRDLAGMAISTADSHDARLDAGEALPLGAVAVKARDKPVPVGVVLGEGLAGGQEGAAVIHLDEAAGAAEVLVVGPGVGPDDYAAATRVGLVSRTLGGSSRTSRGVTTQDDGYTYSRVARAGRRCEWCPCPGRSCERVAC